MKTPPLLAVALLALAGCLGRERAEEPAAPPPAVLRGVPIPERALIVDTSSTPEAMRAVLSLAAPADSVVAFYRRELPKAGFRIVGDVGDSVEADLYARRDGPPLWVQVRRGSRPGTTLITLIGATGGGGAARPDSARGAPPR